MRRNEKKMFLVTSTSFEGGIPNGSEWLLGTRL